MYVRAFVLDFHPGKMEEETYCPGENINYRDSPDLGLVVAYLRRREWEWE